MAHTEKDFILQTHTYKVDYHQSTRWSFEKLHIWSERCFILFDKFRLHSKRNTFSLNYTFLSSKAEFLDTIFFLLVNFVEIKLEIKQRLSLKMTMMMKITMTMTMTMTKTMKMTMMMMYIFLPFFQTKTYHPWIEFSHYQKALVAEWYLC